MNVREILLPCGRITKVSAEDWPRVSAISWSTNARGYVRGRWRRSLGGHGRIVLLHRFIMSAPAGMVVDHIDNDGFNNTRENLQITTTARNVMRSRSGGVTFDRHLGRWRVRKRVDGTLVSFGLYDTREQAEGVLASALSQIWGNPEINQLGTVA